MLVPLHMASSEPGASERTTGLWHENKQVAELKQPLWCTVACNAQCSRNLLMVVIITWELCGGWITGQLCPLAPTLTSDEVLVKQYQLVFTRSMDGSCVLLSGNL